ncbi:MAG: peptide deformylase [Phycisphaerae bacterium]|nr:MAG: peptide deformylase [Phycisphaerae bacterium]
MTVDPATLGVRLYPDPILRRKAETITLTDEVRAVARRMIELMHEHDGIGLAAPQVGLSWRLFVSFVPESDKRSASGEAPSAERTASAYINPVLSAPGGALVKYEEGCLSLPEISGVVHRPDSITITATGLDGVVFSRRGSGLLARCWQHEVDHLDGVLILDRMTQIYRMKNRGAVRDLETRWTAANARMT